MFAPVTPIAQDIMESQPVVVTDQQPSEFYPSIEVVATYVTAQDALLLLQRTYSETGCWGVPAGKVEKEESLEQAMRRELLEETGLIEMPERPLEYLGKLFIIKPEVHYIYHCYHLALTEQPTIMLNREHCAFGWFSREEISQLPLMVGANQALHYFDRYLKEKRVAGSKPHPAETSPEKKRSSHNINVYLILIEGDAVLLHLRKNSRYYDDYYGLISGHVEAGESARAALIREAFEEAGIQIETDHLHFAHCLHRETDRLNVDLFFTCNEWLGTITNCEPNKCVKLAFYPLDNLPEQMIPYLKHVLGQINDKILYSEMGWQTS